MKKVFVLISAVLLCTAFLSVSAEDVRPTDVDAELGEHLVIKTQKSEMFSWDGIFQAGIQYGAIENEALKLPKTDARQMVTLYYDQGTTVHSGEGEDHWDDKYSIDTKAYKYFTVTYKSAGKFTFHWMFSYNSTDGSEFDANGFNPDFEIPASAEWTTAILAIPADKVSSATAVTKLTRWDLLSAEEDVYIKDIGFFTSEADANAYYNPQPEPTPSTDDSFAAAAVILTAAAAGITITLKKKR